MVSNFFVSSNIMFGKDSVKELPAMLKQYGAENVMIVYDNGVKMAGIADQVLETLKEVDVNVVIFDKVLPNPTNELVEEAAKLALNEKIELFIAVGGGSSIDLTKAVNILMTNPGPIGQYGGIGNVKNDVLPLIAIPTTAGTSSEITNVVALTDTVAVCKYVIIDNKLTPNNVIIDPEFTKTMPASVTAATGMDAVTHAVESYISNMATPLTEYNSLKGLEILYNNLPKVVADGTDMEARERMMLGCIVTGFGFSNANLGLVHGIAHTLSAHFHLAHGMANASVLPYVMEFNAESCPEKMVELAKAIGLSVSGEIDKDKYLLSNELKKLIKTLGIKTLSKQGIKEKDFEMLAEDVIKEPVLNFNPRQNITKQQVLEILKKAL
ncbi:alcohol dehydrogenase [Clostridium saccharoperbutylacetonicum]|uniref:Alcohol dehydrogenase, class IV n=2 Tax=Clostridium TaxID=1485 RepID=M1MKP4_9CLOT|nr:iron-containing alcohol dehydrogenase [Clostridium saccharoperbutylacetonicum]AGF58514.1 alcohol dehydrogenase, class IV [Clostridium saccharoperbutylacetonicum N1-4(HMT)]NRT60708.1 alcohol dehydrogenase [Clostridium saccharoperbutylacetonicum]NSB24022.1 alcohol dehydrogenase [Clostridium saccharoperbutylacetonicum]NSB43399.1 alcohol dehydrogenase [Clostridium saccharoperbutylacetonicum]